MSTGRNRYPIAFYTKQITNFKNILPQIFSPRWLFQWILPIFKEESAEVLQKLFQRKKEGTLPHLFCKASINLILKSDKILGEKDPTNIS